MVMKKYRMFLCGHYDKEIKWINNMSRLGFNFVTKYSFLYVFEKNNSRCIFAKDFWPKSIPEDLRSSRMKEYQKNHIDLILKRGNWYYFARDAKYGPYMLHDTQKHQLMFLRRMRNSMISWITLLMIAFEMTFDKISSMYLQITYIIVYLVLAFLIIINFVSVLRQLNEKRMMK